jgi:hypothetical protein
VIVEADHSSRGVGALPEGRRRNMLAQLVLRPNLELGLETPLHGVGRARLESALGHEFAGYLIAVLGAR